MPTFVSFFFLLGSFAKILKGQTLQPSEQADGHFSSDVTFFILNLFSRTHENFVLNIKNLKLF